MQNQKHMPPVLAGLGINALNAMQLAAQDAILHNDEILLLSPTGSGKTLAFLLPVWQLLDISGKKVQCLILTPSRELALQIDAVWKKMTTGFKVNTCYGGHSLLTELQNLSTPPALLIGTPGRIADLIRREAFLTDGIHTLVLDEFDKSLGLGFHEDMSFIIGTLKNLKKRVLVSATGAVEIPEFTGVMQPQILNFIRGQQPAERLSLKLVRSASRDKAETAFRLLCFIGRGSVILFCNHREAAERTARLLQEKGLDAGCFHGGMEQADREQVLARFRNGTVPFLVATDLAARGLDIPEVRHIVHYHLPATAEEFVHRNGRTARMHASGTAYILHHEGEPWPEYVSPVPEELPLPRRLPLPAPPEWDTLFIKGGRKDKLNKTDIVGFLSRKGMLERSDLGLVEVKDHISFAAVKKNKIQALLRSVKDEKMKGKKYLIRRAG